MARSSSDYPVDARLYHEEQLEREALAAGRKFVTEEDCYAQREAERKARIAAARPRWSREDDEHPIDPQLARFGHREDA